MKTLNSEFLFTLEGRIAPPRDFGAGPRGNRRFFAALGGSVGPRLKAEVLPDGGDWLLIRPDGLFEQDVQITLRSHDGALIYMRYEGVRHASPEVAARLAAGEPVSKDEYYFRIAPRFETGSDDYAWLNYVLAIGVGERMPYGVKYDVFAVL